MEIFCCVSGLRTCSRGQNKLKCMDYWYGSPLQLTNSGKFSKLYILIAHYFVRVVQ